MVALQRELAGEVAAGGVPGGPRPHPPPLRARAGRFGIRAARPFDLGGSWLASNAGLDAELVRVIGAALVIAVAVAFVLSGLATAGIVVPSGWWRPLVAISAVMSRRDSGAFFDPQLVLGLAIDGVLLWVVVAAVWMPTAVVTG